MTSGHPALIEHIREAIRRNGPVTFAWFMEQALYHPEHGYYSSGRARIGRGGDYFTNVSVGPLFGRLLTAQFAEMWQALGRPNEFSVVEQGAHDGQFARDVLDSAQAHHPEFFRALRYGIVEPFVVLRKRQQALLIDHAAKLGWHNELPGFTGIHFSNELLDAMPVHLVKWTGTDWLERHVVEEDDAFGFADLPPSSPELSARLSKVPKPLPAGYETEINLHALRWLQAVAAKLNRGFVMVADYGFARAEFFAPARMTGTLQCYANHKVMASPLTQVGQADISAQIEWTSLIEVAAACGLTNGGFCDQHHFVTGLLAGGLAREFESSADTKTKRALQTLLHPGLMGMKFQFLVLSKNAEARKLSGLRFSRAL